MDVFAILLLEPRLLPLQQHLKEAIAYEVVFILLERPVEAFADFVLPCLCIFVLLIST